MEKQQIFDLAAKASAGDKEAFAILLEEKSRHILYNAYDYLKNHHDAEDAAQEIAVKMFRYIQNLREPEYFNAWLHSIIRNVCISKLRKSRYYKDDLDVEAVMDTTFSESLIEKDSDFLPQVFVEEQSLSDTLLDVIRELPARRRRAVILYYYEDLSQKEISEILGVSESTVASNLMRARKDIKEKLSSKTGIDIDMEMSTKKKASALPVLGQVLTADAAAQFGPESIAKLTGMSFTGTSDVTPKQSGSSLGVKVVALVTSVGVVAGSIFIAAGGLPVTKPEDYSTPSVTKKIDTAGKENGEALPENGTIVFGGGDCECGHENPSYIKLEYDDSVISEGISYSWEVSDSAGSTVTEGTGKTIDLSEAGLSSGKYTARFILTGEYGNVLGVERNFEIK